MRTKPSCLVTADGTFGIRNRGDNPKFLSSLLTFGFWELTSNVPTYKIQGDMRVAVGGGKCDKGDSESDKSDTGRQQSDNKVEIEWQVSVTIQHYQ